MAARPPLVALKDVRLQDGPRPLFDGVDLAVEPRSRAALVGRNGAGKSTLMKVVMGLIEPDSGDRSMQAGVRFAYVPQEPVITGETLADYAASGEAERWTAESWLETFGLNPNKSTQGLSGGAIRRAARTTPVVVFPDTSGKFDNDTECVNGPRGNAADHLTKDVMPYVISRFNVSPKASNWGLVGWSSGGTCALVTAVRNPDMFTAFVALDGQLGPNTGTKPQTIGRLYGGDADAWAAFDPRTVITKHGRYEHMSAWLGVSGDVATVHRAAGDNPPDPSSIEPWDLYNDDRGPNANKLCTLLSGYGIECSVVGYPGEHDFTAAGVAFARALPWLAHRVGTPQARQRSLPGADDN